MDEGGKFGGEAPAEDGWEEFRDEDGDPIVYRGIEIADAA